MSVLTSSIVSKLGISSNAFYLPYSFIIPGSIIASNLIPKFSNDSLFLINSSLIELKSNLFKICFSVSAINDSI